MKIINRLKYIIAALFAFVIAVISGLVPLSAYLTSHAESTAITYSNVLDDLNADSNFDETAFPVVSDNYSLSVITISESVNLQLFVYVYQPSFGSKTLVASSINISREINNKLSYKNYKLNLLSQDGVFQKYVVNDLIVNSDDVRYYEISSIFRVWDSTIDQGLEPVNDNTIDEVSFAVGKQYTIQEKSGKTTVSEKDIELIQITEKYVGFMRYPSNSFNFSLGYDSFDVHYIAFSTDRQIDELLEADVYYCSQSCHIDNWSGAEYGNKNEHYAYLNREKDIEVSGKGWFSTAYNWNAIETGSSFVASEHATYSYNHGIFDSTVTSLMSEEDLKTYVASRDWVLRFAVTEYVYWENGKGDHSTKDYTIVGEVSILRLQFKTDGIVYNLGVVDNKQTGSLTPDNETRVTVKLVEEWWQKIIAFLLLILFVIIFWPLLVPLLGSLIKLAFTGFGKIIKFILTGVLKIATLPLRLISWLWVGKG